MNDGVPVLIAMALDGTELFCLPEMPFSDNGIIRTKDGATMPCSVTVALEKMPFYLFDPAKIEDAYRREVIEKIQSGEADREWMSGSGLKLVTPPPQPEATPDDV